jgi:large subunit ribosomal protein L31
MKKNIHPKLNLKAKVTDVSSGQTFHLASTKDEIAVEVSNLTHPFYTGKHRIVDTENLVKKFEEKRKNIDKKKLANKKEKRKKRRTKTTSLESKKKLTLKDMLKDY